MPKLKIVYGLVDENNGAFSISFPDAPRCTGHGKTREAAIENGATRLRRWEARGGELYPRTSIELGWDDGVKLALQLGMELVAVPL